MSVCLVCDSSTVATCTSIPAARFAFLFAFYSFCFLLFVVVLYGEPKQDQGRGLVYLKLSGYAPQPYPTGHSEKSSLTSFHETPFLGSVVAQLVKQVSLNG